MSEIKNKKPHNMGDFLAKFSKRTEGSVLPIVALSLPVLIGVTGLGADASLWMANKRMLQTAADSGVLAAGWEIALETDDLIDEAAFKEAVRNGYDPAANGELSLDVLSATSAGTTLGLTLTQDADSYFSQVLFDHQIRISSYAEAFIGGMQSQFCFMSLHPSDPDSFTTSGSVVVDVPDCGVAVNSDDAQAMSMNGDVDLNFHEVRITGDYEITGGSAEFSYDILKTGMSPLPDPYAEMEMPDGKEHCPNGVKATKYSESTTLSPGTYCGGIDISGTNDIVFEPGIYFIDGGDFNVSGGGTLYGEGVTFILTGSGTDYANLDITGGRVIEFSAPLEGEDMQGIVFFQDRDAPYKKNEYNKLTGTAEIIVNGTGYFPTRDMSFGGNNATYSGDSPCTRMIAQHITISGNPTIGNNCDPYGVEDIGVPLVYLVR